jgi:hypothetical protein
MATITIPRADLTTDEVAELLQKGLGAGYTVRTGGHGSQPVDESDRLTVGTGSARVFRAKVTITRQGNQTTVHVSPGGFTPPLRIINQVRIVAKVSRLLRAEAGPQ